MYKDIIIYVDMDNVLCDYNKMFEERIEKYPETAYPQSQYGFFEELLPVKDALNGFDFLSYYFDVWILSAPSVMNPMCYTEKRVWVEKYLGYKAAEKLILSPNKALLMGHYLIDDIKEGRARQNEFIGDQLVFGSKKYPDWVSVMRYFTRKYKLS